MDPVNAILPEPDNDDHYPTCPVLNDAPESEVRAICDCDEETIKIRADFAAARYEASKCY